MVSGTPADWLTVARGDAPLLVSLPHTGTAIPDTVADGLVSLALARTDTDWWIDRLYDFAGGLGATVVRTAISRTVIDVNRDPSGASLYPGQATTGLCPATTFDGRALYRPGCEPDEDETGQRRAAFFAPYHAALAAEVDRLRRRHGHVVLYDAHSIRSVVPRLFRGELPVFNIGTNGGRSCAPAVVALAERICGDGPFSWVRDGRFKGGWITRSLGAPTAGVHAIQMELACRAYMAESEALAPAPYDAARAQQVRAVLERLLLALANWAG